MVEPPPEPHGIASGPSGDARSLLASFIRLSNRFALAFAVCNTVDASLSEIDALRSRPDLADRHLAVIRLDECESFKVPIDTLEDRLSVLQAQGATTPDVLLLVGLGAHVPLDTAQSSVLSALNMARDLFPMRFTCPMVFFVSEYLLTMIARQAPDFAAWASLTAQCARVTPTIVGDVSRWRDAVRETEWDRPRLSAERLTTLEGLLQECIPGVSTGGLSRVPLAKDVLRELLQVQVDLGARARLVGLMRAVRDAAERGRSQDVVALSLVVEAINTREPVQAMSHCRHAVDMMRHGTSSALAASDDARLRPEAMARIADVLTAHGELDEALSILREEAEPAFKELGDVRSRAVTMGRIADILSRRGDYDEALRIRREEVLPVYERLGDVHGLLVGRANTAVILLSRYQPGDRDEARELLNESLAGAKRLRLPREQELIEGLLADL